MNPYEQLLSNSEVGNIWRYFRAISKIPRPSKQEQQIRQYILQLGRSKELELREDDIGNIVFALPGRGNLKTAPVLILQAHMDMVCEKNRDVQHDFMKDPIRLMIDGDWVIADGTTLGADNGVAVAMMLALIDAPHQDRMPLELLFTIDEETGLTGAMDLDPAIVNGRMLLNLDSEDEGVFTIGCSGGRDLIARFRAQESSVEPGVGLQLRCTGFKGGHSGVDINKNRGNAILALVKVLDRVKKDNTDFCLLNFSGGNKKNAIPREAVCVITGCNRESVENHTKASEEKVRQSDPNATIEITECQVDSSMSRRYAVPARLVDYLNAIPNGLISMDPNFPDLVQTSSSAGVATQSADAVEVLIHTRSSCRKSLDALAIRIEELAGEFADSFVRGPSYTGWSPNPDSQLLKHGTAIFGEIFDFEPTVESIHAGLEAGVIGEKLGTNELLAIGPTIKDPHSPDERVHIDSVTRTYRLLERFVTTAGL